MAQAGGVKDAAPVSTPPPVSAGTQPAQQGAVFAAEVADDFNDGTGFEHAVYAVDVRTLAIAMYDGGGGGGSNLPSRTVQSNTSQATATGSLTPQDAQGSNRATQRVTSASDFPLNPVSPPTQLDHANTAAQDPSISPAAKGTIAKSDGGTYMPASDAPVGPADVPGVVVPNDPVYPAPHLTEYGDLVNSDGALCDENGEPILFAMDWHKWRMQGGGRGLGGSTFMGGSGSYRDPLAPTTRMNVVPAGEVAYPGGTPLYKPTYRATAPQPPAVPVPAIKSGDPGFIGPVVPMIIQPGKQGKHIEGHPNYIPGKSILDYPKPQGLLDVFGGNGTPVGNIPRGQPGFKERIDFGVVIGRYKDPETNQYVPTTKGIFTYAKDGVHLIPARP